MLVDIKNFNWRILKRLASPGVADDLNNFLERLPQTSGKTALIAGCFAWVIACVIGLFTVVQIQTLSQMRDELFEAKALDPVVPKISTVPVTKSEIEKFVKNTQGMYSNLDMKPAGTSIVVSARSTSAFPEFREALGHIQSGGKAWRVSVERLCAGRECSNYHLSAELRVNEVKLK